MNPKDPGLCRTLSFSKSAAEIVAAAKNKAIQVKTKIEERQKRVIDLRREYGIDDAAFVQLLQAARKQAGAHSYSYTSNARPFVREGELPEREPQVSKMEEKTIGAGVVNNLLTENDFIESEKDQVKDLEFIVRNLKPIHRFAEGNGLQLPDMEFVLSQDQLEYLGF